jgi:hypothetical protein
MANNEVEKASQFRQGLRPSIRHTLGAFPLIDFRTTVEQALGVEMQHQYTSESSQKYSRDDQSRGQDEKKGYAGGPVRKKGKFQRHHPYHGKFAKSSALGGGEELGEEETSVVWAGVLLPTTGSSSRWKWAMTRCFGEASR